MNIGYIGLGKMGLNMVLRMKERGHDVVAYNRGEELRKTASDQGIFVVDSIEQLISELRKKENNLPITLWLMVSYQAVDSVIEQFIPLLQKGDTIIDGGNSFFKDSERRAKKLTDEGINFLDIGTSGGPAGARNGACLMIGGNESDYSRYVKLFTDLSAPDAFQHVGNHGAGHFVKMVHNGIEYGMMQAIAEGFAVMKAKSGINLKNVTDIYNHQSVIESRLIGWLLKAYEKNGEELKGISGTVSHSGEGLWTVETAKELGVPVNIIEQSLQFRIESQQNPSYTGQIVSALRNQFGGHNVSDVSDQEKIDNK